MLDVHGLHRHQRDAVRGLQDAVEGLQHLVSLLDTVACETFPHDDEEALRRATTQMRAAVVGLLEGALDVAMRLGAVRSMALLEGIAYDDPDDEDRGEEVIHPEDGEGGEEGESPS